MGTGSSAAVRVVATAGRLLVRACLLVAALAFLGLAAGPHLLDYRTATMLTESMRPAIASGDVVVLRSQPVADVRPGQLLTFSAPVPGSPVLTHRVTSVSTTGGATTVTTRGDANDADDPWRAQLQGAEAWHGVAVVPYVGRALHWLRLPVVHVVSLWLVPGALCLSVLSRLWRRPVPVPALS